MEFIHWGVGATTGGRDTNRENPTAGRKQVIFKKHWEKGVRGNKTNTMMASAIGTLC